MNRNEKKKGSPALSLIVLAVIAVANIFGFVGLLIVAVIAMAGVVFWTIVKASRQSPDAGGPARRAEQWPDDRRYPIKGRPALGNLREDNRHRMEELDDLFKAGIIDQAEYRDRMAQIRNEGF